MNILRLGYEKPTAFALCASILDLVAFARLSLFKTKVESHSQVYTKCIKRLFSFMN
ncbi:hypothetical protein Hanom_Chr08g00751911 [Helianthus anomalus]